MLQLTPVSVGLTPHHQVTPLSLHSQTIVAVFTLLPIRLLIASVLVVLYAFVSVLTIGGATEPRGLPYWTHRIVGKFVTRMLLFVLGFHFIEQRGHRDVRAASHYAPSQPHLKHAAAAFLTQPRAKTLVANHAGYVDILVMMALCFPAFVAKVSISDDDGVV